MASAWIIFNKTDTALSEVRFMTRSGELVVTRGDQNSNEPGNVMSLPSATSEPFTPPPGFADALARSLNMQPPAELHISAKGGAGATPRHPAPRRDEGARRPTRRAALTVKKVTPRPRR